MTFVSCIMPTRGREVLALKALQSFKNQIYEPSELVILDDEDAPSFPLGVKGKRVQYHRASQRLSIAQKRNECCRLAKGEVIVHWDSDDWSAPIRVTEQVGILGFGLIAVTGYNSILFYDERNKQAYRFERERRYAIGTSLAYRKAFWQAHPFKEGPDGLPWGEDNGFVWEALQWREIDTVEGEARIVARMHNDMTCPKDIRLGGEPSCGSWRSLPVDAIPKEFFA